MREDYFYNSPIHQSVLVILVDIRKILEKYGSKKGFTISKFKNVALCKEELINLDELSVKLKGKFPNQIQK